MNREQFLAERTTGLGVELRPVAGYEGCYSVSSDGRVWSHARIVVDALSNGTMRSRKIGGRWLNPHKSSSYLQAVLQVDGKRIMPMIHRLVAAAFVDCPDGMTEVNHKDGNKLNNDASNLEWVTRSMNIKHARAIGLQKNTPARQAHGSKLHHTYAPWRNK